MAISAIVAGTGFYRPDLIRSRCRPGTRIKLVREPRNPHDRNAIAVHFQGLLFSPKLGHLKAPLARRLAPQMDAGATVVATVASTWAPPEIEHPRLSLTIEVNKPSQKTV